MEASSSYLYPSESSEEGGEGEPQSELQLGATEELVEEEDSSLVDDDDDEEEESGAQRKGKHKKKEKGV